MAITVEDGSLVENANAYASVATVKAWALARNRSLPGVDADIEPLIIQSTDWLEAQRERFQGSKVSSTQALQFPRKCVYIDNSCDPFPEDEIPNELINAQCELVCTLASGVTLRPAQAGPFIKAEEIAGVIKTEYSESVGTSTLPLLPAVEDFLSPLVSGGSFSVRVSRA